MKLNPTLKPILNFLKGENYDLQAIDFSSIANDLDFQGVKDFLEVEYGILIPEITNQRSFRNYQQKIRFGGNGGTTPSD